jgi:thiol-disulfide isomerase/thioredoxin
MKNPKKYVIPIVIVLLILFFLIIPFFKSVLTTIKKIESLNNIEQKVTPYPLKINKINLLNIRSEKIDTIRFRGVTIINFWATWCKPCIDEQPYLENLQEQYPNIKVLQFSFDSLDKQSALIKKSNWKLNAYFIKDSTYFEHPKLLPKTLILKDSLVIRETYGLRTWSDTSTINLINKLIKI